MFGKVKQCKHKYEPRYNEKHTTTLKELGKIGSGCKIYGSEKVARPYLEEKTYVHDICVRCGDIKI